MTTTPDSHTNSADRPANDDSREPAASPNRQSGLNVFDGLTILSTFLLVNLTILSLFAREWWLADLIANLRVQWLIALGVTGIVAVLRRRWIVISIVLISTMVHVPWTVYAFRSPAPPTENSSAVSVTVTTANVHTANRRLADIERELLNSETDLIAVVELSTALRDHLATGSFAERYPHSRTCAQDSGNFGMGLYSRHPFETARIEYFNDEAICSVVARLRIDDRSFRIVATHTLPPMGPRAFRHRNRHLELLSNLVQQYHRDEPETSVIVMGDLNVTPWSPVFTDFVKESALSSAGRGQGLTPTWYSYSAFPFGLILDHVLSSHRLTCSRYSVGKDVGSDHRFVTVEFSWGSPDSQ